MWRQGDKGDIVYADPASDAGYRAVLVMPLVAPYMPYARQARAAVPLGTQRRHSLSMHSSLSWKESLFSHALDFSLLPVPCSSTTQMGPPAHVCPTCKRSPTLRVLTACMCLWHLLSRTPHGGICAQQTYRCVGCCV